MLERLVAFLVFIVIFPVILLLAVVILLTDGRPIFFRQTRVGQFGRDFKIFKFRSMRNLKGAEQGQFDAGSQSRVTKVGAILRKTKMDELPQILNVINGTMSFAGPRPEVRQWVETYPERWARVHKVKPGITDPASIRFRNEEALLSAQQNPQEYYQNVILPAKLDLYESYIAKKSLGYDLKIIAKTLLSVVKG
ncbi:MAG: sugar transferase [Gammaproteobacteria bacterium]|nr:sugar transferase [Gammaproteobacteria bacterium]NVK89431.1 sugar transferase [Gammaproteobacteria bacterium]